VSYRKVMLETRGLASFHTDLFYIARDVGTVYRGLSFFVVGGLAFSFMNFAGFESSR
jgi:hypothetical protein